MLKERELNLHEGDIARKSYEDAVQNLNLAENLITEAESGTKELLTEDIQEIYAKLSDASAGIEMAGANGDMTEEIIENNLNDKLDNLLIRVSKLKAVR